ncbi:MAG: hypothetical protein ACOYLL_05740, partial [Beijerinckiaceae bacterium]
SELCGKSANSDYDAKGINLLAGWGGTRDALIRQILEPDRDKYWHQGSRQVQCAPHRLQNRQTLFSRAIFSRYFLGRN